MNLETYNSNKKIIGSIIKLNRINQNLSQKALSSGICVPSYLSRIESGDLIPSEEVLSVIFNRLGLTFNDSSVFIDDGISQFNLFFEKLNYNEFDFTNRIFEEIESKESDYITSPLILDYFIAKLARYCSSPERDKFKNSQNMIISAFELLSPQQKFLYDFYVGVDTLLLSEDKLAGKEFIQSALQFKETGHCHFWLSYAYRLENNPIKAYDSIKKALNLYVSEGNIISIMSSYEKLAEVYFLLDNYSDAIQYLKMALNIANKINNNYFIEHLNSLLAWSYYRLESFEMSLNYLKNNTGLIDHRIIIPDSLIQSLIYFKLGDKESLKVSISKFNEPQSLVHLNTDLSNMLYKFFNFYIEDENYLKSHIWEGLLIYIIDSVQRLVELKKVFNTLLKEYYIHNRRYKDALFLQI